MDSVTLPRLRYDGLIELCWLNLFKNPVAVYLILLVWLLKKKIPPSIMVAFDWKKNNTLFI